MHVIRTQAQTKPLYELLKDQLRVEVRVTFRLVAVVVECGDTAGWSSAITKVSL